MNLVFGTTDGDRMRSASSWARARYGRDLEVVTTPDPNLKLGVLRDRLVVTATRPRSGAAIIMLGSVHAPVGGWSDGNPQDDPHGLAEHLLNHYLSAGLLPHLSGQFAICFVDDTGAVLVSDTAGLRTWFYDSRAGQTAFASNLRILAEATDDVEMNRADEDFFLINGYYPPQATPYAQLKSSPPGRFIELGSQGAVFGKPPTVQKPTPTPTYDDTSEAETVEALYDVFMSALEDQVSSEVRVGVLLGGFDSALVAAGLKRLGKDVDTFSFSYAERRYNQPLAEVVAASIGARHHWVEFGPNDIELGLRTYTDTFNYPTNWPNYVIQTAEICIRMRELGITQCFSGDGCDSIFLGYPGTARRARVLKALSGLPRPAFSLLLALASRPSLERIIGHPYRVLLGVLRASRRHEPTRTFMSFRILDEISLGALRSGEAVHDLRELERIGDELAAPHAGLSSYRLAYQGKAAVSPNKNKMIGSADRSGVTVWSPYMHPSMKRFALGLPESLLRPSGKERSATGKYVLQRMASAKQLLPDVVVYQPKVAAVDAPIDKWYGDELKEVMLELWKHLPFDVDWDYATRLLEPSLPERLFRDNVMVDNVVTHAASLLATYGAFAEASG